MFVKMYFLITRLRLGYNLFIWTTSNRVKSRFFKFTIKKSWLENYSVKSQLKSLKLQNLGFTRFKCGLFFCEGNPNVNLWLDDMLLAVFEEIDFTPFFFARKYGIGKLIKMNWILINNVSNKKFNLKKDR